jgi:hypothetical protein
MLSLYAKLGSTSAPTEEGEVADGYFPQSPLTKLYDTVLAEWSEYLSLLSDSIHSRSWNPFSEEKHRIWTEKQAEKKQEQGLLSEPSEESLGTAVIFKMTHITEETAGAGECCDSFDGRDYLPEALLQLGR